MRRAILLFVKHPEPGKVKTRLAAAMGAEKAAEIYRLLVAEVIRRLPENDDLIVMFDPPEKREAVAEWLGRLIRGPRAHFAPQATGDLGVRLEFAFAEAFARGSERVAVIGSDCVEFDADTFAETWRALETNDCVIGPSFDGGYYLLALKQPCGAIFHEIEWSTDAVFAQTAARAEGAGMRVHELPRLHDVDTEADWLRGKLSVE